MTNTDTDQKQEERIQRAMKKCQHFDGTYNKKCKAGVLYSEFKGGLPCVGRKDNVCEKFIAVTREQAEERENKIRESMRRLMVAMPVISEWRNKEPKGKAEVIECPVCNGKLHLSQSAYNGHVHARCETDNCLCFME